LRVLINGGELLKVVSFGLEALPEEATVLVQITLLATPQTPIPTQVVTLI
jgi:hypothetical protein